jgi:hypothetical protein
MLTMNTPNPSNFPVPPTFEVVVEKLKMPLLDVIKEAIAEGALHVSEYTNWQAEQIDFALAPNLVRHKAKQFLSSRGQEAKEEEAEDTATFETEQVPNNGLYMILPGFRVRILKSSEDGSVPPPGMSETRKNFYNQQQALLDFGEFRNGDEHVQPTWGLIVHWTVDEHYTLLKLSLALPLRFIKNENGKSVVECAFDEPFWIRPPQDNVISITDAPTPPAPTNLDLEIVEETGEKTGEESKDE